MRYPDDTIGYTRTATFVRTPVLIVTMNKAASPKILVVDDDVRLRDLLSRYLSEQGFQVTALADASHLDRKLQRDPPHLVVLDLMLPGEDGLAVCRRLRAAGESVPIIMLTAKGEDVDRIVGLEMGADDYMAKPFNPRELKVLALLHHNRGNVVAREHILNEVWGIEYYGTTRTLDQLIVKLRQKIETAPGEPKHLLTVHGFGYRLEG